MSSYDVYDLSESIGYVPEGFVVARVVEAWGVSPEGYGSWTGGFLLESTDGRWGYLTGWCDTSGWGCQDGVDWYPFQTRPTHAEMIAATKPEPWSTVPLDDDWDPEPADLNKWVRVGRPSMYTEEWARLMGNAR